MTLLHAIHRIQQAGDALFAEQMNGTDMTARQGVVLKALLHCDGLSQTELVERTGIDRSTISDLVQRLSKRSLLGRKRNRRDARAWVITLTPAGTRAARAADVAFPKVAKAMVERFPALGQLAKEAA